MPITIPETVFVENKNNTEMWARLVRLLSQQKGELPAGENFGGRADMTKCATVLFSLDEEAIKALTQAEMHEAFETKENGLAAYDREFTYDYVEEQNKASDKQQFVYNYFHRLTDYPLPSETYFYQGKFISDVMPGSVLKYRTPNNGFDQVKWLHDAIRTDGISRRHQMITWIPVLDCFSVSPPCLQRIQTEVLVPKSEWYKYPGCIPAIVHIDYRSWDIGRAMPSNLYGLTRMMYRYVFGNLDKVTEYVDSSGMCVLPGTIKRDSEGVLRDMYGNGDPVHINDEGNKIDFKIVKLVGYGDNGHLYNDSYDLATKIAKCR